MTDDQTTRGGVAHARPLTRRQQKLARPQQKPQSPPQPRQKLRPESPPKTRTDAPHSRAAKAPAQPTTALTTQPQATSPSGPGRASVSGAQHQPASSAAASRVRRTATPASVNTAATVSSSTPSPSPTPTAPSSVATTSPSMPSASTASRGIAPGSRKHPTLAAMTNRAPTAANPAPAEATADASQSVRSEAPVEVAGTTVEPEFTSQVADDQWAYTAGLVVLDTPPAAPSSRARPTRAQAGQAAPEARAVSADRGEAEAPTNLLQLPPRSRIETHPIAALDILRRLPNRSDAAPDGDDEVAAASAGVTNAVGAGRGTRRDAVGALDDLEAEGPPTLPTTLIPLRTYSRPLGEHNAAGRRQGLLARFGRADTDRPASLEASLVIPVAATHALVAVAAALVAAALAVMTPVGALWALALALLAGVGAGLGFTAAQRGDNAQGALWLLLSELGVLAWGLAALGPRPALVALTVGSVALALRSRGRTTATCTLVGALTLYAGSLLATFMGMWRAPLALGALSGALLDAACVATGLTLALAAMAGWASSRAKADAAAQASQHEAAFVSRGASAARERTEADAERLARTLGVALQGRGLAQPTRADGPLSPLAETINVTAERIATLQRDREDRLRLEGALTGVLHAVERAWLGLTWSWPDPTGTPLDDLVALLRAPRPQDVLLDTRSTPSGEFDALSADEDLPTNGARDRQRPAGGNTAIDRYGVYHAYDPVTGAGDLTHRAPFADDDQRWPEVGSDALLADFTAAPAPSQPSHPSFPMVEIHRRDGSAAGAFAADDPAFASYTPLNLFDASVPQLGPVGDSAWESTLRTWPSWPDPWADEDDDPADSASRHVTPPPRRRRWNEWSSQPGAQEQSDGRGAQPGEDRQAPQAHGDT